MTMFQLPCSDCSVTSSSRSVSVVLDSAVHIFLTMRPVTVCDAATYLNHSSSELIFQLFVLTCMGKPEMGRREDDWLTTSGPLSILV